MKRKVMGVLAVGALAVAVSGGVAQATAPHGISNPVWSPVIGRFQNGIHARSQTDIDPGAATAFWKVAIDAKGATDVHVLENVIAAGGSFGWHSHPGPSLVVVRSGMLSVYHGTDCTSPEQYGPGSPLGSTFVDDGHDLHMVRNNTGSVDDVYVISFVPAGFNRRIDEPNPNPAACPD
jgi:quercetin dioxygenase-like cupin family protein